MDCRLLVVSGIHLDRAWPDELVAVGRELRRVSATLVLELVQQAIDLNADAVAILGGLWEPTTVRSSVVDDVAAAFGALSVPVVVVPGRVESDTAFRPESMANWSPNVLWLKGEESYPLEVGTGQVVALGPQSYDEHVTEDALGVLTTRSALPSTDLPVVRPLPEDGARDILTIPKLVTGSGGGRPKGALVTLSDSAEPAVTSVSFSADLGQTRTLDIGQQPDSRSLVEALNDLLEQCNPLDRVIVTGRVGPRVLVPPALDWEASRSDVTVLWRDLHYVFPEPEPEHTVQAELIRHLAGSGPDQARRHQALALGLESLSSQEESA